ncbi:unnamed protein product [Sphenostylis stenocarpa]|uniref:Bifunctional inhibitor/plant lipid transfer protein/seed storage helical domain-containing protein n=1 Tax=Sphenostylis stenocarpa TaxID=92480 RepID=A0AA86VS22_9FABA|nr:unnamed protein product [Sphenostylis stenocarpa]
MKGKTVIVLGLLINMMLVASESEVNGITCGKAVVYLLPCETFLLGLGPPAPSLNCCTSIAVIFRQTKTVKLRRYICNCLKKSAIHAGVKHERVALLPKYCKTHFSFLIDPFMDCDSVQ